jgi:hypothetical protein
MALSSLFFTGALMTPVPRSERRGLTGGRQAIAGNPQTFRLD